MNTDLTLLASLAGAGLASGGWLVVARLRARRPGLDARLAPYLRPADRGSALLATTVSSPFPVLERLLAPVMTDALRLVERLGSPTADLEHRLRRAGGTTTVDRFRSEQVVAGAIGTAVALTLALMLVATRGTSPITAVALTAVGGATGAVLRDRWLSRQVAVREARMLAELPTVAELLALSAGAGEGVLAALDRVARLTHGEVARELRATIADVHAGTGTVEALESLAARTGSVPLSRFTEALAVAVERGTPLAEVLRSQAADVREAGHRSLMETGGRKEIAMMVPVVLLILPVTVLFAVFPGIAALRLEL